MNYQIKLNNLGQIVVVRKYHREIIYTSLTSINDNHFHHIAIFLDERKELTIYLDGINDISFSDVENMEVLRTCFNKHTVYSNTTLEQYNTKLTNLQLFTTLSNEQLDLLSNN